MNNNRITGRSRSPKLLLSILALVLMIGIAVSVTLAAMFAKADGLTNTFQSAEVEITVKETFDGSTKSNVYIQNNSTTGAYIRAKVVVTWQDGNGNVFAAVPVEGSDYQLTGVDAGWFQKDGFWYWQLPVAAGEKTKNLIGSCQPQKTAPADGYTLHVEILAQAIQAVPAQAVTDAWKVTVASDGSIG